MRRLVQTDLTRVPSRHPPAGPAPGAPRPAPDLPDEDDDEDWSWIGHDDPDDRESEGWWERFRDRPMR